MPQGVTGDALWSFKTGAGVHTTPITYKGGGEQYISLLAGGPIISVPTITLEGDANGAPHPGSSSYTRKFSGKYANRIIKGGIGHNLPQEAPWAFAEAIVEVDGYCTAERSAGK